ncbi:MAG: hypothetical protein CTY35_04785 [Methylotenera sp.]|uniref:hypothetical protein n=1 Tax=Methylotenera sp. TaxID=2051956 RepID=UPI000D4C93A0|nr:hypothetical protein [Methylotenera sp.]PPC81898.1 MAG: hypothetical protein CTY38_07760 [Methylotenera sp.]PPC98861.1 MAG: hypothetical protein CTY35_04785 [Methylotenera sp.]
MGSRVAVSFGVTYCPNVNAFVYAHKQSAGATQQGVYITIDGVIAARKNGQSEGHIGYESTSTIIKAGECFLVGDTGGGQNRLAWYRPI